jgi:hypothetical protein
VNSDLLGLVLLVDDCLLSVVVVSSSVLSFAFFAALRANLDRAQSRKERKENALTTDNGPPEA